MPRPIRQQSDSQGHNSFLDIVANIVGILIILVLVTGVRVKNAPAKGSLENDEDRRAFASLENDQATEQSLRQDVIKTADQIRTVRREQSERQFERDQLATMAAAWEQKIEARRGRLDDGSQEDFELVRDVSESRLQLDRLRQQKAEIEAAQSQPARVESYPTPLSKTVDDHELHFQLRGGRVAFVPLEKLLEQFQDEARQKSYKLLDLPELTETVGPEGGFRLRYTLERRDVSREVAMATGRSGSYARLKRWTLIPVSSQLGEPIDEALAEGSRFRAAISEFSPKESTVTIWTYPDSFQEFRRLKKELFELGFPTAARPLPDGVPIGGSPQGTKSAAE